MAIKIIKLSKKPDTVKRFERRHCGCVFVADRDDYEKGVSDINLERYAEAACPFCGYFVRKSCNE